MIKLPLPALLALAVLVLAGCTTPTTPAPQAAPGTPLPAAPATPVPGPSVALPPATLTGYEEKSTMLDNFTVYVAAVDGVPITAGRAGWSTALRIKAGPHRVVLGFSRGVFEARTEVAFTAASATAYQVKFATDAQIFGKNTYCEFWIEDTATGAAVTERRRVPLARAESAN